MNKRLFSIALALVLMLGCCAFAASKSIAVGDVTDAKVTGVTSSTGAEVPAGFAVTPVAVTETTKAVVDDIAKAADAGDLPTYFGATAMAEIAAKVPNVDVGSLKLDEVFPFTDVNYASTVGDVTVNMRLTKDYKVGDVIVALIGVLSAGNVAWTPVDATVVDGGEVAVTLPQAILEAGATNELVFALLSE